MVGVGVTYLGRRYRRSGRTLVMAFGWLWAKSYHGKEILSSPEYSPHCLLMILGVGRNEKVKGEAKVTGSRKVNYIHVSKKYF